MKADNRPADYEQSMLPIVFWTVLLAVLFVGSLTLRFQASDPPEDSKISPDRLVRFDSVQFLTDFRAINS